MSRGRNSRSCFPETRFKLLNSCESLSDRLWNFWTHYGDRWHEVDGDHLNGGYYFNSFVYRLVAVFSWIAKIEEEMVYIDTTIASEEDMQFIKYLRLLPRTMCDAQMFEGLGYDASHEKDHFFRNNLDLMAQSLRKNGEVCSLSEFDSNRQKYLQELDAACRFVDGVSPHEERLRWDRLQILHVALIAFVNSFGYDFQRTSAKRARQLLVNPRPNRTSANFAGLVERTGLHKQPELRRILKGMAR